MPFSDEQILAYVREIMEIWAGRIDEKLPFTTIIEEAEKKGMNPRTVSRYLKVMTGEHEFFGQKIAFLERTSEPGKKAVCYKPMSKDHYFKAFAIQKPICAKVDEDFLKYSPKLIEVIAQGCTQAIDLYKRDRTFHAKRRLDRLNTSSQKFLDTLKKSLSNNLFETEVKSSDDCYRLLWEDITEVVSAYMELWALTQGFENQERMGKRMDYLRAKLEDYLSGDVDGY